MRRRVVVGVGNTLMGDEGLGVEAVRRLKSSQLPTHVEVYECGTGGLKVLELIEGAEKAIILDAVKAGGRPGDIHRLLMREAVSKAGIRMLRMLSLHDLDLTLAFKIAESTGAYRLPEDVVILGVEPACVKPGTKLSREVEEALDKLIKQVLDELGA